MAEGRWRFVWSTWAAFGGLIGGLGIALLLQQFGAYALSIGALAVGAVVGLSIGVALPSLLFAMMPRPEATA